MHQTVSQLQPSIGSGLTHYLGQIRKFPILTQEEETRFARRWRQHGDRDAAYRLVTSHLRLVAKIAMRYRGYGLPIADIVSEGNVGLMQAVRRFDPERGIRLSTYAMWWIKATIQEYVLRSWSLVKISASSAQKKLFFKLRRTRSAISALDDGDLRPDQAKTISERLKVSERDVVDMDRRLRGDVSLNSRLNDAPQAGDALERLVDPSPCHDIKFAEDEELAQRRAALKAAIQTLSPRERHIFTVRQLTEAPPKLDALAIEYGISRERVRQIESRAFQKVKSAMQQGETCRTQRSAKSTDTQFARQSDSLGLRRTC
ncbi:MULTISPECIES: RNA polymerase sigma factor RpoH [unclassified Bradyrhizobium]|uniref:RNA polymerase sigma factor RpoH n=1 Tax=unclassified Bradyrhizobium TaxID=2631580 RepID=UPI001BA87BE5|nr:MULTISPECIES: RNA polymerase sigma factor RpoH [unclassified Bradyrhizobium]MBR1204082.1 RNA polymerase sigma factor RpoH [Bradyrhizobium sp. AUGA SZCCT0124]MBR1310032.1 RNA polymerase sigma factor RpoH [Bradyrhizobium sp. AUGA SZCCT0051]MBR1340173.1 RNA polymerase sigma factor RpoH [Bradyrhizobium sp. AUGA SZCCT0105]MBR1354780.1 RNA polymerase sigma factor RpoH [Bradyrhizobium sp. AUGA SZCCT0045]